MAGTLLVSNIYKGTPAYRGDADQVDGIGVSPSLFLFCTALRRQYAFRHCLFGVEGEYDAQRINGAVWVYAPDELFARGKIGFGDVGVQATLYRFYVETEQIRNYKVKVNRRQYNMLSSENMERMVIAGKKHLRPYPTEKIVGLTAYKLTTSLSREKEVAEDSEHKAMSALRTMLARSGMLTAELVNMVKVGYAFKDSGVKDAIVAYMSTINNDIEVCSRNISIALVLVHPPHTSGAEHVISVQKGMKHLNLRKRVYVEDVENSFAGSPIVRYSPDTLPTDIREKISALNILDINSYVDGLGLRQSENIYYIAEDA